MKTFFYKLMNFLNGKNNDLQKQSIFSSKRSSSKVSIDLFRSILIVLIILTINGSLLSNNSNKPYVKGFAGLSVSSYSGNLKYDRTDLTIPCRGLNIDISFNYYFSKSGLDFGFGYGWSMTGSMNYVRKTNIDLYLRSEDGSRVNFRYNSNNGIWEPDRGFFDSLYEYVPGKFIFKTTFGKKYYFDDSTHKKITKITDLNNNEISFTYTGSMLSEITDPAGRSVQLTYTDGRLTMITDPNTTPARTFQYQYDANGNMIMYTDPLGNTISYNYNPIHKLLKITDKNFNDYFITYANTGRVRQLISQLRVINFYFDPQNLNSEVTEVVNNITQTTKFKYLFDGLLKTKTGNCCGFNETYVYGTQKNIIKRTDANNNEWLYTQDSKGNTKSETDPVGNKFEYVYDLTYSRLISRTDPRNFVTTYDYDADGNMIMERKPMAIPNTYTYDANGNVTSFTDGNGNTTQYQYDAFGNRNLITFPDNTTNSFIYDNAGNKTAFTDENGNTTTYTYDLLNRLIQTQDAIGNSTYNTYDGNDNMISNTDKLGHVTQYMYDALNRKIKTITPAGTESMTYDERGNILSKTDRNGNITRYTYDSRNLMITEVNPLGHTRSFAYDNVGNKVTETDFSGNSTSYVYDAANRLIQVTDALSNSMYYTYDASGNKISETDKNGNITSHEYDQINRLVKTIRPFGTISYTYDNNDNVTSMTDGNGHVTNYVFDQLDRRVDEIDAAGHTSHYEYDDHGNVTEMTDRNGKKTLYTYDGLNRRVTQTNAMGELTSTVYDAEGKTISRSMPNGNTQTNNYDNAHRLISTSDDLGLINSFVYDGNSNRVSETDGNGNTIIKKYDALNRLILVKDAMGKTSNYTYNNNSSMTGMKDRNGNLTSYTYDALERKISTVSPSGIQTAMSYDAQGNMISITDDNGNITRYAYDANNRKISESYADRSTKNYTYDKADNLISRKDNNGNITNYKYDAINRLTGRAYPSGEHEYFTYDNENSMLTAVNKNANIVYTYDNAYRKTSETMNGKTTAYNYDIPGKKRNITYPGGRNVMETYNDRMKLTGIASGISVSYTYDAGNRMLSRGFDNGVITNYSYNANNWMTSVSHVKLPSTLAQFDYSFDNEGNRLTSKKTHLLTNSEKYNYDLDYRVTNFKEGTLVGNDIPSPLTQSQFDYDGVGNRNTFVKDGDTTSYQYNSVNAYTSITDTVTVVPEYDANGNLKNDGNHSYEYDLENRMISADGGATGIYKYDALGRRIQKVTSGGTINYYYDDLRVIEERDGSDATAATYIYGTWIDDILSMNRGGTDFYYLQNSLGSVIALTNSAGDVTERYEYDAYGNPSISVLTSAGGSVSSASGNTYLFTGREYDAEINTYHYRARFYKPDWGRFGQWDPPGIWYDMFNNGNGYLYVYNNPLKFIDITGANPILLLVLGGVTIEIGITEIAGAVVGASGIWAYLSSGCKVGEHKHENFEYFGQEKCQECENPNKMCPCSYECVQIWECVDKYFTPNEFVTIDVICSDCK